VSFKTRPTFYELSICGRWLLWQPGVESTGDLPVVLAHNQSSESEMSLSSHSSVTSAHPPPHHHQPQTQHPTDINKKRSGWVSLLLFLRESNYNI